MDAADHDRLDPSEIDTAVACPRYSHEQAKNDVIRAISSKRQSSRLEHATCTTMYEDHLRVGRTCNILKIGVP